MNELQEMITVTSTDGQMYSYGQANGWRVEDGLLTVVNNGNGEEFGSWAAGHWMSVRKTHAPTALS